MNRNADPARPAGCAIDIRIDSQGGINIYNCSAPTAPPAPCAPPREDCPPTATGACVPLALGAKPKQSRRRKLERLLARNPVPSALASAFFHTLRRFDSGQAAGNALEADAFARLARLSPALRGVLRCSLASFDSLPKADADRLAAPALRTDPSRPVDEAALAEAIGTELLQRASLLAFGDALAVEQERPGRARVFDPGTPEHFLTFVNVCRVNGLRTATFQPPIALADYGPAEIQQRCVPQVQNGQPVLACDIQRPPCPGHELEGTCLRVPEVESGSAVLLEGVNFFSVNARVRVTPKGQSAGVRLLDAHVFGDLETQLTEEVGGQTQVIRDCRVHDRLSFRVPDDLAPGLYEVVVVVPNTTGIANLGPELLSPPQFVTVVPPSTARFQIATEKLTAVAETSPARFGSDEVGIRFIAIPLLANGDSGDPQVVNVRFGDVDSGESRAMNRVLFTHNQPIAGVALSVTGYEIDSEDAFEKQIDDFSEVFVDLVKSQWEKVKGLLAGVGGVQALKGLGLKAYIALAIAAAVVLAIDFFYSLWAPADLIIDDAIGLANVDLALLTSLGSPLPPAAEQTTERDIRIQVRQQSKEALTYFETRRYLSDDEDSRYEIRYRYNRLA